jgi:hypothetical protein
VRWFVNKPDLLFFNAFFLIILYWNISVKKMHSTSNCCLNLCARIRIDDNLKTVSWIKRCLLQIKLELIKCLWPLWCLFCFPCTFDHCIVYSVFLVLLTIVLFILFSLYFWPLCCLFCFNWPIIISTLISSNSF